MLRRAPQAPASSSGPAQTRASRDTESEAPDRNKEVEQEDSRQRSSSLPTIGTR